MTWSTLPPPLLDQPHRPTSLRERARRAWVARRTELFYAQIDLVELRHAVDPRNARRPVLLVGEPGSGRGILAHYIHQLAEPVRDELVVVPASSLGADSEQRLLEQTRGRRVSVYLEGIDRVEREVQERLLQLLGSSGALGLEPIRWIASVSRARALIAPMRQLPWLHVQLPSPARAWRPGRPGSRSRRALVGGRRTPCGARRERAGRAR